VWNHQVSRLEVKIYGAYGVGCNDPLNTHLVEGVNVGAIVHLVRRNGMVNAVTRQKGNQSLTNFTNGYGRREPIGGSYADLFNTPE